MKFQVGMFLCELSLDDGGVEARWFLADGRRIEPPKYLDAADRRQYRVGREEFLRRAGKAPARLPTGSSWTTLRRLAPVLVVAVTLTGCARGGAAAEPTTDAAGACDRVAARRQS
jgi:hypothetical protein